MVTFFSFSAQERIGKENLLIKLGSLINWTKLRPYLKGIHKNDIYSQGGPEAYDHIKMFKAILLGQWYSLSDPALEESLRVRLDFMVFTGFELLEELPDETTLCRFRNKLIERGIDNLLFEEVNRQLENFGLKVEKAKGAIIDATIIESANRPRKMIKPIPEDRQEAEEPVVYEVEESPDRDARWLKKGKRSYFGYKGFIVTDEQDGYIGKVMVTPANESEMNKLKILTKDIKAKRIYADKGYCSENNRKILKSRGYKDGIMSKAKRGRALTFWERIRNRLISKRRFIVERAFGTLKRQFIFQRASYQTRKKVEAQLRWKSICFNLLKASKKVAIV